ncbi:MAG: metal-dependent transcriptional regulator [Candidatus Odinarchaeota archaeon]
MSKDQDSDEFLSIPESYQRYICEIYRISHNKHGGWVTNKELAESLNVERPSITGMLHKLKEEDLINWTPRKAIRLTKKGREYASKLDITNLLLRRFFKEILEIEDNELIEKISCDIEHHITEKVQKSLKEFIDYFFELRQKCEEL